MVEQRMVEGGPEPPHEAGKDTPAAAAEVVVVVHRPP